MDDVLQQMDAVLSGRGTVQLHVPGICIPPRGRRLPTRTPSTAHFLFLPFFALLTIGGDEVDISSFWRSAAARGRRAWRASISRIIFPISPYWIRKLAWPRKRGSHRKLVWILPRNPQVVEVQVLPDGDQPVSRPGTCKLHQTFHEETSHRW